MNTLSSRRPAMISSRDDKNDGFIMEARRLTRLYGSKSNLKKGKIKERDNDDCVDVKLSSKDPVKNKDDLIITKKVEKFFKRNRDELMVEIHADNYNIKQPWFVGYRNTTSLQGSPQALASRYGSNGAIRLYKIKDDDKKFTKIENSNIQEAEQIDSSSEIQVPMVQSSISTSGSRHDRQNYNKSKKLERVFERETALWRQIVDKAKLEKKSSSISKGSQRTVDLKETKLGKYCVKSVHINRTSIRSNKIFVLN